MAEGLARHLGEDRLLPQSAGLRPKGLHPLAIAVMDEIGIDIRSQISKALDAGLLDQCDSVITLCADADAHCPVLPPQQIKQHWPLSDPAAVTGSAAEQRKAFRKTRDEIRRRILDFLEKEAFSKKELKP